MNGHDAYARLWELAQDNHGAYDLTDIQPWMVQVAFPALVGEGHCHRCHGFEDGPCHDEHGGAHGCPACATQRRLEQLAKTAPSKPIHLTKKYQHCELCASGEHQRVLATGDE